MLSHLSELSCGKTEFSRKITGKNNPNWLVSIKHGEGIYEELTFHVLMEVTVVRMFSLLRHSYGVLFLLSGAF